MPKLADFTEATSAEATDRFYLTRAPHATGFDRRITLDAAGLSPLRVYREETLDAATIATATTIDTVNASTVRVGDWVCVDAYTTGAEVRRVTGVSTNTLTLHAQLNNAHDAGDTVVKLPGGFWDVRYFGAAVDGSTDDTAAWNAAVDDAEAVGGGVVTWPLGTTVVSRHGLPSDRGCVDLDGKSNIAVIGSGIDRSIIKLAADTYTNDIHVFLCDDADNLHFDSFTIDGNGGNHGGVVEQMHGIESNGGGNITVHDVRFWRLHGTGSGSLLPPARPLASSTLRAVASLIMNARAWVFSGRLTISQFGTATLKGLAIKISTLSQPARMRPSISSSRATSFIVTTPPTSRGSLSR